jgi:hypothetical protein
MSIRTVPLESDLELFIDAVQIVMHSSHKGKAYKANVEYANRILESQGIFVMAQPKIVFSDYVSAQSEIGPWEETGRLKHPFIQYLTPENKESPPGWMIFFGIVKRKLVDVAYVVETPSITTFNKNVHGKNYWKKGMRGYDDRIF